MSVNLSKPYTEVYEILKLLDKKMVDKVPNKFIQFLEKEKDDNYFIEINPNVPLEEQNLLEETINILAILKLDYWCVDENEKKELMNLFEENERKYQNELYERYNPEDIFKENKNMQEVKLVVSEELKWYQKIINKIRNLLKRD